MRPSRPPLLAPKQRQLTPPAPSAVSFSSSCRLSSASPMAARTSSCGGGARSGCETVWQRPVFWQLCVEQHGNAPLARQHTSPTTQRAPPPHLQLAHVLLQQQLLLARGALAALRPRQPLLQVAPLRALCRQQLLQLAWSHRACTCACTSAHCRCSACASWGAGLPPGQLPLAASSITPLRSSRAACTRSPAVAGWARRGVAHGGCAS